MPAIGSRSPFSGEVICFRDIHPASRFIQCLNLHLQKFRGSSPGNRSYQVPVHAYLVDEHTYRACCGEEPPEGELVCVYVCLDKGAAHACREFGMCYSAAALCGLPESALPVIDDRYCSATPLKDC
jgi:hypothetical protein